MLCACFLFAIRTCFQFWRLCFSSLTRVSIATEYYCTQQDLYLALWGFWDVLILHKRWCVWQTSQGFVFYPHWNKPLVPTSSPLFLWLFLFVFCSSFAAGDWWTQRMSSVTSSLSLCPQRCATGWPPPSPDRWAWCCDGTKKSLASGVSSTLFKLAYLSRGKLCKHRCWIIHVDWYLPSSNVFESYQSIVVNPNQSCLQRLKEILSASLIWLCMKNEWEQSFVNFYASTFCSPYNKPGT